MSDKTTADKPIEVKLSATEWIKIISALIVLAAGMSGLYYKVDTRIILNEKQIKENKAANERTATALVEVTRLVDRMSGREEARDERQP